MAWFEPALSSLTDTEQHILSEYYMGDNQKSGATHVWIANLVTAKSHGEIMSNVLNHLRSMLFWINTREL